MAQRSDWTADRVASLRLYWSLNMSAAEICRQLGVTRNAVLGKAHRLDLPTHQAPPRAPRIYTRQRRVPVLRAPRKPVYADPRPCSLVELTRHTCRWPEGDPLAPEFFFCGAEPVQERPYCLRHCEVAYRPRF